MNSGVGMTESYDVANVVIVGSGPSGAVTAHTLAERSFNVVCLEQGYNEVRPHSAIGNRPPITLMDRSGAHGPP